MINLSHLECSVCHLYLESPISSCSNSHSLCPRCRGAQTCCPLCNYLNSLTRDYYLEHMLHSTSVRCRFNKCESVFPLSMLVDHEKCCAYNPNKLCIHGCGVIHQDITEHLIQAHSYKIFQTTTHEFIRTFKAPLNLWENESEWPLSIWRVGNRTMVSYAKVSMKVFHLYLYRTDHDKFPVHISIHDSMHKMSYKGSLPYIYEWLSEKVDPPHFNCQIDILMFACDSLVEHDEVNLRLEVKFELLSN